MRTRTRGCGGVTDIVNLFSSCPSDGLSSSEVQALAWMMSSVTSNPDGHYICQIEDNKINEKCDVNDLKGKSVETRAI